jgi:hypothetical protein
VALSTALAAGAKGSKGRFATWLQSYFGDFLEVGFQAVTPNPTPMGGDTCNTRRYHAVD